MKKSVAQKWIAALRSKRWKQGKGALKCKKNNGETTHCCLGVLCELYQQEQRQKGKKPMKTALIAPEDSSLLSSDVPKKAKVTQFIAHDDDGEEGVLPEPVRKWAGMETTEGNFADGDDAAIEFRGQNCYSLIDLNDGGYPFAKIADVIEKSARVL